jgi:hypothetical protein
MSTSTNAEEPIRVVGFMTEWTRVAYQMDRKPFPFRSEVLASQRLRNHFLIIIIVLMITRLCRPVAYHRAEQQQLHPSEVV